MKEFLNRPYPLRQFVVVERDEIIETKLKAQEELDAEMLASEVNGNTEETKHDVIKHAAEIASAGMKFFGLIPVMGVAASVGSVLSEAIVKSIEKQKELIRRIPTVNYISFTESTDFKFPIGHPRENELYVAHPTQAGTYYPMNEFHRKVFEHKFTELNKLLMDLGAKKVEVEYVSGWGSVKSNDIEGAKKVKAGVNVSAVQERRIIYHAEYKNNESHKLPENMAWYHHEPTWQSVGDGRINHDLQNFNLTLEYNDDFGINADLFAEISKIGFGTKNSFEKKESTVWKVIGEF